ncbi:unnamed protein product [Agarophyton chilense]|eukprot:gb/GEZJ01000609.1/.p1 GENE.gb/GEZJ01000609.1/~~gb/GEZJ01000609.1/.p1  ORF type:complete len:1161 (+),score=187.57 gb/GEZJ01000609.1/:1089-4571(+)
MATLQDVPERISFPHAEQFVLNHWKHIDAFRTSNKLSEGRPVYSFYDGPPFATGLPHYGHLLAGTIKDIVTRFAYQTGHHVPRRFGWDCHGLPIEFEIEKQLGIKSKDDVLSFGIANYNAECRKIVMRYAKEWQHVVNRLGRWIDFENDYKTLDTTFMESIWWVFKTLHDKNLVYKGFRVMPYSTACTTPLSNFEAGLNYKEVDDPAVTVSFPIIDSEIPASFLAWTTTPWTLPSNLALCVHPQFDYVYVADSKSSQTYVLAESRLVQLYKNPKKKKGFEILKKVKGVELVGLRYKPLFDYFVEEVGEKAFRVLQDEYVTDSDGTGIVHQAPAFGEDDHRVCIANNVVEADANLPCPVDANGKFTLPVTDFEGLYIKDADKKIVAALKDAGRLVKNDSVNHRYPFCWRSDTPLMQRAVPSWFVRVTDIKDKLVANNKKTYWVPGFVQHNRFGSWLENARDWNVSRNRYWGTPLPIWVNDETGERLVIGSIKELEELSGKSGITDIHRENVDCIEIKSPTTGSTLRRVPEVFDCWFESGSMPFSSQHYPFESDSAETFKNSFPADFVAEGLDQTRGWFYTLMVLSTALYDKPAFKNCVVNGLVLAEDGKKMSKRLKNYPDPAVVFDSYGADALRLYLINSPVVRAEPLRFREDGVRDVVKDVMLPWFNALRFLVQNARALEISSQTPVCIQDAVKYAEHKNQMDHWIDSALGSLTESVHEEMGAYRLYTVVPKLLCFINSLTDWYVRLNRPRLKGFASQEEQRAALGTLGHVLLSLSQLMAPFAPFFAEYTYQILKPLAPKELTMESVHFLMLPNVDKAALDKQFEVAIEHMKDAIVLGRLAREHREIPLKQPLKEATVVHRDQRVLDAVKSLEGYVKSELNIRTLKYSTDESEFVTLKADADGRALGKKLGKSFKAVFNAVKALDAEQVSRFEEEGKMEVAGHVLTSTDVKITRKLRDRFGEEGELQVEAQSDGLLLVLNTARDDDLRQEGLARELINRIQKLRKKIQLRPEDQIEVFIDSPDENLLAVLAEKADVFRDLRGSSVPLPISKMAAASVVIAEEAVEPIGDAKLRVCLSNASVSPSETRIAEVLGGDVKAAQSIANYIRSRSLEVLSGGETGLEQSISIRIVLEGKAVECELEIGTHIFKNTADRIAAGASS